MKRPDTAGDWFDKAEEDFLFACESLDRGSVHYPHICFHFQQAAEKYLKAFIVRKKLDFLAIHNLIVLLGVCSQVNPSLESLRESCILLNAFYVDTRYPVHWPSEYDARSAGEAREAAAMIRKAVKATLQ